MIKSSNCLESLITPIRAQYIHFNSLITSESRTASSPRTICALRDSLRLHQSAACAWQAGLMMGLTGPYDVRRQALLLPSLRLA